MTVRSSYTWTFCMGLQVALLLNIYFRMQNVKYAYSCVCPNQWRNWSLNVHQLVQMGCKKNLFPHFILNSSLLSKLVVMALQTDPHRWSLHRAVCRFSVPWYLCLHPVFLHVIPLNQCFLLIRLTLHPIPEERLSMCVQYQLAGVTAQWNYNSCRSYMNVCF